MCEFSLYWFNAYKKMEKCTIISLLFILYIPLSVYADSTLNVTLKNGLSHLPLANKKIVAFERERNGLLKWVKSEISNRDGKVTFCLEGIDSGRAYVLKAEPYNTGPVYSRDLTTAGNFDFLVGRVQLTLINGATGKPLPETKVNVLERLNDSETAWYKKGISDNEGVVHFDLDGFDKGKTYLFMAASIINGAQKFSHPISQDGAVKFIVGSKALNVTLRNAIHLTPLPDRMLTVYERLPDGSEKWADSGDTDVNGQATFDLEGIDDGRTYFLTTKPYDVCRVSSDDLTSSGNYDFNVGKMPVTLIDVDTGMPIIGQKISALLKLPDGNLQWVASGISDSNGIVHFDLDFVEKNSVYIFQTHNPFGNDRRYYSDAFVQERPVNFEISREENYSLDLIPPFVTIESPLGFASVSGVQFEVSGRASDNQLLKKVTVSIIDPIKGVTVTEVGVINGYWRFLVTGDMVTTGKTVTLRARAYDRMLNVASASIRVHIIDDVKAPALDITSHASGDEVADTGFILAGITSDNTGIVRLTADVEGSSLVKRIFNRNVEVSKYSGRWAFVVNNLRKEETVKVTLEAVDMAGNTTTRTIKLVIIPAVKDIGHLINRITFGATPELFKDVRARGVDRFINQQLNPDSIDDSEFEAALHARGVPESKQELHSYQLFHTLYSKRQLLEVMTFFWDNHFNTDIEKTNINFELRENQLFRQNALGKFRDLLQISATSPAMLKYLDNYSSCKEEPNENYARELMELHTMGVDGGYTAKDIAEVARVFTGWGIKDHEFYFAEFRHDDGEKEVLGHLIPAGSGIGGGEQVLDILASHPSVARFISTKLLQLFISDSPSHKIVNRCSSVFLETGGDIAQTVRTILNSEEFFDPKNFHGKVKTPLEFISGFIRNIETVPNRWDMKNTFENMGMPLFRNALPTGWGETGDVWLNSNQLLQRMLFVNRVVFNKSRQNLTFIDDPSLLFIEHGYETVEGVVGYLFQLAFNLHYTSLEWNEAVSILTENGNSVFDIFAESAQERLRALIGFTFSLPHSHLQ